MKYTPFVCFACHEAVSDDRDGLVSYSTDGFPFWGHNRCDFTVFPKTRVPLASARASFASVLRNFMNSRPDAAAALSDARGLIDAVADVSA